MADKFLLGDAGRKEGWPREHRDAEKGGKKSEKVGLCHHVEGSKRDPSLRSEDVTKLPKGDFFVSDFIVFSVASAKKTKKSQPLRMTMLIASSETAKSTGRIAYVAKT
jgi:hypothetical protein